MQLLSTSLLLEKPGQLVRTSPGDSILTVGRKRQHSGDTFLQGQPQSSDKQGGRNMHFTDISEYNLKPSGKKQKFDQPIKINK